MTAFLARWAHRAVWPSVFLAALWTLAPIVEACGPLVGVEPGKPGEHQAERLLEHADLARWSEPISYKEMHMLFLRHGTEVVAGAIMWRPPWDLRVEEERDGGRRIAVWNDQEHWLYDSRLPYVLHTGLDVSGLNAPEPPTGLRRPLSPAHKAVHWAWGRSQGPGGRPVYVVEGGRSNAYSRYWIDEDNYFPWKEEHYGPGCELVGVIVRSDVDFDPELGDELFRFEPPQGTEVIEDPWAWRLRSLVYGLGQKMAMAPAVPAYVPPGYTLVGGGTTVVDGQPALHLRFHDGQRLLSVFQMRIDEAGSISAITQRVADGRGTELLVSGTVHNGYLFLVVGDLTPAEAERILAKMEFVTGP